MIDYLYKKKLEGLMPSKARKFQQLEEENARLCWLVVVLSRV